MFPLVNMLVGYSRAIQEIRSMIAKVAPTESTVLITGETGVGKEMVAQVIHLSSRRKNAVFLPVNCASIPEALFESQLFGYVKGAFTGATACQRGFFKTGEQGSILLDEIGEMPLALQPKLLRALEKKEILPVGSSRPEEVDVRIIASTNRELKKAVEEGRFREDLYYRLNVVHIHVPPLRERCEDIPILIDYLIGRHNAQMKKNYRGVETVALEMLMSRPWPGNVREMDNVLERAMIIGNGEWITVADLCPSEEHWPGSNGRRNHLKEFLRVCEKVQIELSLKRTEGNKRLAARTLGVSRSSLYRRIEKLNIQG